jgi:hypothetical protein
VRAVAEQALEAEIFGVDRRTSRMPASISVESG